MLIAWEVPAAARRRRGVIEGSILAVSRVLVRVTSGMLTLVRRKVLVLR